MENTIVVHAHLQLSKTEMLLAWFHLKIEYIPKDEICIKWDTYCIKTAFIPIQKCISVVPVTINIDGIYSIFKWNQAKSISVFDNWRWACTTMVFSMGYCLLNITCYVGLYVRCIFIINIDSMFCFNYWHICVFIITNDRLFPFRYRYLCAFLQYHALNVNLMKYAFV
jgi:hypothetical protein